MSRVIVKIKFRHPNFKTTNSRNVDHVNYIATRPGTDKTITEKDLENELDKELSVASNAENIDDEFSITNQLEDDDYLKYIDERPNSHGLFGENGHEDLDRIKEEIAGVNSYVWRGIISLKEDDAKDLGYLDKSKWQDLLNKKMPDIASEMKISLSNFRWVGAVHMEKGHPHAHVMYWEVNPTRTLGIVKKETLESIRKGFVDDVFEDERFQIMTEKDLMRELINDLAKGDMGKASLLVKEVRASGQELQSFVSEMNKEGVQPKLYKDEELVIADKINNLANMLPGHGRANLKFMPEDVKAEVRAIADYLLKQPDMVVSLEKNLKAVEDLTRMYTGKEDDIKKARENAYNDMRDRVSQIVLKGAVESLKENTMYVDRELADKAIDFISKMNNQINLVPERVGVLNQITTVLIKANYSDSDIQSALNSFMTANNFKFSDIPDMIKKCRNDILSGSQNSDMTTSKKIDYYLSHLKLNQLTEKEAFEKLSSIIKSEQNILESKFNSLKENGLLKTEGEYLKLTNKGIVEILKVKDLDTDERQILKALESVFEQETKTLSFKDLLENKDIFSSLRVKDPDEFKLSKYDTHIRFEFGESNKLKLDELENRIYEKYTDDDKDISQENEEKAKQEFDSFKSRIDKLVTNGYVVLDKESDTYSFTNEANDYFKYDQEKDTFSYTDEAMGKLGISKEMEFTGYDANVTLSYLDRSDNEVLSNVELQKMIYGEIANKQALAYYESFNELFEPEYISTTQKYISIDEQGNLQSTEEGKWLGVSINQVEKFIKEAGDLQIKTLSESGNNPDELKRLLQIDERLKQFIKEGVFIKAPVSSEYGFVINPVHKNINSLLYQIYKEDGSVNRNELKAVLEKNIPNREAEKQFNYISWRLNNLKEQGFLSGSENAYSLTEKGIEKRSDILVPEREQLRKSLSYLERLGLLESTPDGDYQVTQNYFKYMKSIATAKDNKLPRESELISKEILKIIDRTQDKVDLGKIERVNEKVARGKFINNAYEELKTDYESVRDISGIKDITASTISKLSTTLLVSGVDLESTKATLSSWYIRSHNMSPFEPGSKEMILKVHEIVDKSYKTVKENNLWGKTTVISSNDWKEMFKSLGVDDKDMPKWIYKGENWQSFKQNLGLSAINDLWKNTWKALERQRLQTEAQAEHLKKILNKQQSANKSIEAIKEQVRKNKSNSLYKEDDFEY